MASKNPKYNTRRVLPHHQGLSLMNTTVAIAVSDFTARISSALKSTKAKEGQKFEPFGRLPTELRMKVWEETIPEDYGHLRQALEVALRRKDDALDNCGPECYQNWPQGFHQRCGRRKAQGKLWLQTRSGWKFSAVPAIFFACQESRQVFLQCVVLYINSWAIWRSPSEPLPKHYLDAILHAGTAQKLRHLAINVPKMVWSKDWSEDCIGQRLLECAVSPAFLHKCENLNSLWLVVERPIVSGGYVEQQTPRMVPAPRPLMPESNPNFTFPPTGPSEPRELEAALSKHVQRQRNPTQNVLQVKIGYFRPGPGNIPRYIYGGGTRSRRTRSIYAPSHGCRVRIFH